MPRQITTAPEANGRRDFLRVLGGGRTSLRTGLQSALRGCQARFKTDTGTFSDRVDALHRFQSTGPGVSWRPKSSF